MESLVDDIPSLVRLGQVSSFWRQVSTSEALWRQMFYHKFCKLEPTDAYFLEHGVPKPTLLQASKPQLPNIPAGMSPYWHLFMQKWSLHKLWNVKTANTSFIKPSSDIERFSMMSPWRGFCVTAGSDGRLCFWDPRNFLTDTSLASSSTSSKNKGKPKPWKQSPLHEYHIWWMTIQEDLCFTVGSDGKLMVTNLAPLVDDHEAVLETVEVMWNPVPYWALDVSLSERLCIIGSQNGNITLFEWDADDWRKWKIIRSVRLGAGVWDVCLLPGRRFAACGFNSIAIYDFTPTPSELRQDEESPVAPTRAALLGEPKRLERVTKPEYTLPTEINPKTRPVMARNLNYSRGMLLAAVAGSGIEAWDIDKRELLWTIEHDSIDTFDVQLINNKLVCVGTDMTGSAVVSVFDIATRELILRTAHDRPVGRVFSTCVTDESIYICAVDGTVHIRFAAKEDKKESSSGCVVS